MNDISLDYSFNMKSVIRYRDMMGFVPFQRLAAVPGVRVAHLPRLHAQLRDLRRLGLLVSRALRPRTVAFRDPELLVRDIAAHPAVHPRADLRPQRLPAGRARLHCASSCGALSASSCATPSASSSSSRRTRSSTSSSTPTSTDYSVEIIVESHDDEVRAAFGKGHYTMEQVEESVQAALRNGCKRFDLYFMTGIPHADRRVGARDAGRYVEAPLSRRWATTRGCCASRRPMAPFLDPGSRVFDNPEQLRLQAARHARSRSTGSCWCSRRGSTS